METNEIDSLYEEPENGASQNDNPPPEGAEFQDPNNNGQAGSDGEDPNNDSKNTPGVSSNGDNNSGQDGSDNGQNNDGENKDGSDNGELKESVFNQFLKNFGIMDGKITFDDNTQVPFEELEPEKQLKILNGLVASQKSAIEEQYGLSEEEVQVLNKMRTENKTFDQIIDEISEQKLQKRLESQKAFSEENFAEMADDDLFKRYLKENNKELTDEEINADLETAKKLKNFKQTVEAIRNQYVAKQEEEKNKIIDEKNREREKKIEDNARSMTQIASQIDEIAGWPIDDDMKNEVLEDLVEIDENDLSNFTRTLAQDPRKMFETAWLAKYAPVLFERMDTYYKKEVEDAFEKGKNYALSNYKKINAVKPDNKQQNNGNKNEQKKFSELDSLYD